MSHPRKRIVLTGGGSAGHAIPNLALLPGLRAAGWEIDYIGSAGGIERELLSAEVPYHPISSGKLRRYLDRRNLTDIFRVLRGVAQAFFLLGRLRPRVVFSKGGFVAVPVVLAARARGIPVVIHEADFTPGLANRICLPFCTRVCYSFPETKGHLPPAKRVYTGIPIRREVRQGDRARGLAFCGFDAGRPVLLAMGGSLGAEALNRALREALPALAPRFQIAHICGRGKTNPAREGIPGYRQFEYVKEELPDLFAAADLVVSRAGANSIFELLALCLPHLLIPLSLRASRGDQILNARSFLAQGFSRVLEEERLDGASLTGEVLALQEGGQEYITRMKASSLGDACEKVAGVIREVAAA